MPLVWGFLEEAKSVVDQKLERNNHSHLFSNGQRKVELFF